MSWLRDADLEQMRDDVLAMLPDECDILAPSPGHDDEGESIVTWNVKSAGMPCRLDYKSGNEKVVGAAIQPNAHAILTLPWYATLKTHERVSIEGKLYAVKSVNTGQSWMVSVRAEVEAIQ